MFWRKKEENNVEYDGLPVILSKRESFIGRVVLKKFLAYYDQGEWKGLVGYEEYKAKTELIEKKLDLILKELGKEYVPESEKKEPAKLVNRKELPDVYDIWMKSYLDGCISAGATPTKPKKKRKTTKKKK